MELVFSFNLKKATQVLAYFLSRLGPTDKVKLTKLVYLADREHFIAIGYPITGDQQYAMRKGPVPSKVLDILDGDYPEAFEHLHVNDYVVSVKGVPEASELTEAERATLEHIIAGHGAKPKWALVNETHRLPEYGATYIDGTSRRIPYELIARLSGDERRFRKNRVVISPEAAAQMGCPLPPY